MSSIAVIDYGAGNLRSVAKAFEHLGYKAIITSEPSIIKDTARAVLPGVGAFGSCFSALKNKGLDTVVKDFIKTGKPFLGICVGMQMLFEKSFEFGENKGLGLLKGEACRFPEEIVSKGFKIPHTGWNTLDIKQSSHPVMAGLKSGAYAYFVHSYKVEASDKKVIVAECEHGVRFTAIASFENIFGVQFHPEKSQKTGLRILKNFGEWKC